MYKHVFSLLFSTEYANGDFVVDDDDDDVIMILSSSPLDEYNDFFIIMVVVGMFKLLIGKCEFIVDDFTVDDFIVKSFSVFETFLNSVKFFFIIFYYFFKLLLLLLFLYLTNINSLFLYSPAHTHNDSFSN